MWLPRLLVAASAALQRRSFLPRMLRIPIASNGNGDRYNELGHLFADVLERGWQIYRGENASNAPADAPVVITGAALGLPGTEHIFDDGNIGRLLHGEQFIHSIPARFREAMLDKHITRLVKSERARHVRDPA